MPLEEERRVLDEQFKSEISSQLKSCKEGNEAISKKLDTVLVGMFGDNQTEGLFTKLALIKSSLGRAWIWIACISGGLAGIAFFTIRTGLVK